MIRSRIGNRNWSRGFTLIELMVAIGLATILVGTVAMIFYGSTDIFKTSESRITIYGNARAAMDVMARDISSMLPRDSGQQRMYIWNGGTSEGNDRGNPATDTIQFRAIVPVNSTRHGNQAPPAGQLASPTLMTVHVLYSLRLDDDPEILGITNQTNATATGRPLYVLRKRLFDVATLGAQGTVAPAAGFPAAGDALDGANPNLYADETGDLCHYVLSFNLEWIHSACAAPAGPGWHPAPYPISAPTAYVIGGVALNSPAQPAAGTAPTMPIGYLTNVPPVAGPLPQAIRVTLRVAEGAGVKQERIISRVIWIPLS